MKYSDVSISKDTVADSKSQFITEHIGTYTKTEADYLPEQSDKSAKTSLLPSQIIIITYLC